MHSSPYRTRPSLFGPGRTNQPTVSWDKALSPALDNAGAEDFGEAEGLESFTRQIEAKRREMGWSTSFPAEYHHAHQTRDYQQTLAYQEQLNQRKQSEQQLTKAVVSGVPIAKVAFPSAPSPNRQELELLKHVTMREGILNKLKAVTHSAGATGFQGADTGTELLQLLLHLRDASVAVISAMAKWHQSITTTKARATPLAFLYQGHNYCAKMVADLNFLAVFSALGRVLGVEPTRMKQNPFMMPSPIPERDFHELQRHSASSPPQFRFDHPIDRVAEAEKYLVWSLVNLPEGISNASQSHDSLQQLPTPRTKQGKRELLTWQQRAEQQLRVLSMPLESPSTGQTRVMDSSRMMKRKGYLPSLPQSPSKTLTQLMETVHKGGYTSPTRTTGFASFEAFHDGISYRMTALDIEVLGSNDVAPPHAIVTLVAASVLILLSPSDRIPKELAWPSCQKMLSNGLKLIRRIERVDMDAIPAFKWKALLPFLQNEHYNPMFLMEYSSAAATLCAWVLEVLERAQHHDRVASKSADDRREILEELEQLEDEDPVPVAAESLRPISRNGGSRGNNKRVTIGNAEVLFINENEPVSPPSTAASVPLSNGGSRPVSSSSSVSAITRRHVLLRTSPWTHRGVTYFVSFFLETRDEHPDDQVLSIKLYEPMSSVESQMFVSVEDLRLDFGDRAVEFFEGRKFGLLCDLVLTRLDGMMAPLSSRGGLASRGTWRRPSDAVEPNAQTPDDVNAAAVRIQSLARFASAKKELQQLKKEKEHEDEQVQASVRIQCAARQRRARKKVQHVRFAKQHHSATKIQSLARQRLAQKQAAHMRILQRTPTGLARAVDGDDEDRGDDDPVATRLAGLQMMELTEQDEERPAQREELDEPMDDMGGVRPETSMSYASEQFEDDFEADDA